MRSLQLLSLGCLLCLALSPSALGFSPSATQFFSRSTAQRLSRSAAQPLRPSAPQLMGLRLCAENQAADPVTGTKFEENDEKKNPEKRAGHAVKGEQFENVSPEVQAKRDLIREHQEKCPKLTWAQEIRTLMNQKEGFGVIATLSKQHEGFPHASVLGFAVDEEGKPFFCLSGMSAHTQDIANDPKCSLCVTEKAFKGAADARVTLVGKVLSVPQDQSEELRKRYMEYHKGAYWANFGDFKMYRMEEIEAISFVGGFARAGKVTVDEYTEAGPDPLMDFADPVMKHMNDDHTDALADYVRYIVGLEGDYSNVQMKRLDQLGFDVRVSMGDDSGVLRIPFDKPVTERKGVKEAIVALSQKAAKIKAEKASD